MKSCDTHTQFRGVLDDFVVTSEIKGHFVYFMTIAFEKTLNENGHVSYDELRYV
jgi:hypothetical protein